jgi:polyisoprenyl-phosphate glycosyltransferase
MKKRIDIILPVYKEEEVLRHFNQALFETIAALTDTYQFRVIYVLDRSPDSSFQILKELARNYREVTVLHLSRRFGHQVSLVAGIHQSRGDAAIMMDCDLQHPPSLIPVLLGHFEQGYDIVQTVRAYGGGVPLPRRMASRFFYALQNLMSPVPLRDGAADFRLISHKVVEVFQKQIKEHDPFLRGLFQWVGYSVAWVPFTSPARAAGGTKYDMRRLALFFVDGVLSFSKLPLRFAAFTGFLISLISSGYAVYLLLNYFLLGSFPPGYTSLILVVLVLGGLQLCVLGVIGEYLGRIFDEAKARPLYVVDEMIDGEQP